MRATKAKKLRRYVKLMVTQLSDTTVYEIKTYNKSMVHPVTDEVINYQVYTALLGRCQRALYRELKKGVK